MERPAGKARLSYRHCGRVLERLRRLQALLRHQHAHFVNEPKPAESLDQLVPEYREAPAGAKQRLLRLEIHKLTLPLAADLAEAGVPDAQVTLETYLDSLQPPLSPLRGSHLAMEGSEPGDLLLPGLLRRVEQGLGFYEEARAAAWRRLFNPLAWIAAILSLPMTVWEDAGFERRQLAPLYAWILIGLFMLAALWLLLKLGVLTVNQALRLIEALVSKP
jgi:hypothetical protein